MKMSIVSIKLICAFYLQTYGVTNNVIGWRKDVVNLYLESE